MMQELEKPFTPTLIDRIWPLGLIAIAGWMLVRKRKTLNRDIQLETRDENEE